MKSLGRMVDFLKPYRKEAFLAMLLMIGVVITDLIPPRLTQRVIDQGVAVHDMRVIVTTALLMVSSSALGALLAVGNTIYSVRVYQNVGADIRSALVRKVQTFSFGNLDRIQTGQLMVRATSDVNQVSMMALMALRMLTRAPLWMVGSLVMLILTAPDLAWLMLALTPLLLGTTWLFATRARPLFLKVQQRLDRLNQVLEENLAGVRVVKAFVRMDFENRRFGVANTDLTAQSTSVGRFMATLIPSMLLVVNLAAVGVVWFGGSDAIGGRLTVGEIVAAFNYITRALFPMLILGSMIGPLSAADASAERILEVLDAQPDVIEAQAALERTFHQGSPDSRGARVALEKVSFSYDGQNREPVLKNVSVCAEPGQEVAILGVTGSGKSSLIQLIPRFYDATSGRVTIDDIDVRDMSLEELRSQIGVALQETVLFTGTVRDNIRYGRPDADDEEVVAAAKAAQAHQFITAELPNGYETLVGQRGVNLSGGQKQRIAIARALLVRPRVLILDDSTSSVDIETEIKIQAALDELMQDCTSFVIAQRISTVLEADKIVVLDQGQIAAEGTHAELMASSPIYREIYDSQLGDGGARHV